MGRYKVIAGQNIYDVALHLYGSVEGIVDLLMNNTSLSIDDDLQPGDELAYTDGFVINADVVAYNTRHNIVPAGGERNVYPKYFSFPLAARFQLPGKAASAAFSVSGTGTLEVDWGDNSPVETILLTGTGKRYSHLFDNDIRGVRGIRWFSDASFRIADWSGLKPERVFLYRPLPVEELTLRGCMSGIEAFPLLEGIYRIDLQGSAVGSLVPLASLPALMLLDLSGASVKPEQEDLYLKLLVEKYGNRRSCEVRLPVMPTGEYREPERDGNGRYRVACGMEAVWVILHEPAWNEGGAWKFIIEDKTYTVEE